MSTKSLPSKAGSVELNDTNAFHNELFGYTLFEEIVDPAKPKGPHAIGMHVPANSMSKAWLLIEPGYSERIELLEGSANLVIGRSEANEWVSIPLTAENPTGDDVEIKEGDVFCLVTEDTEATVLSRPSKPFDTSYEQSVTKSPGDELSRFILAHSASIE